MMINNYVLSLGMLNTMNQHAASMAQHMRRISTGLRINSVADDPAGWAIGQRMDVRIRGLDAASRNAQQSKSLLKVAEGGISSTVDILRTLKEKAINAANDTNTDADRATIQKEFDQAIDQIDENANMTYNGQTLVDGSKEHAVPQPGTRTSMTNESLSPTTKFSTRLTELKDGDGNSLQIDPTDTITVSYVMNGKTYTGSTQVGTNMRLSTIFDNTAGKSDLTLRSPLDDTVGTNEFGEVVKNPSGKVALTVMSQHAGVEGQISGLTISFQDKYGHAKRRANALFDNFSETVRAKDPSDDNALTFQVGTKANQSVKLGLSDMRATALGLRSSDGTTVSVSSQADANAAINVIDTALKRALDQQTDLGSVQSRLGYTSANIVTASENTQSAESTIRDANMAQEMTAYTKNNVLSQAAQSMLAQANQNSSSVLSLLQ